MLIITRKHHWANDDGPSIDEQEWKSFLLYLDDRERVNFDERKLNYQLSGILKRLESRPQWVEDRIEIASKSDDAIVLAFHIAARLDAMVQGSLGEYYYLDQLGRIHKAWPDIAAPKLEQDAREVQEIQEAHRVVGKTRRNIAIVAIVCVVVYFIASYPAAQKARQEKADRERQRAEYWEQNRGRLLQRAEQIMDSRSAN